MNQLGIPLLSLLIATPLLGALLVSLTPRQATGMQRGIAGLVSIINLVLAVIVCVSLAPTAGYQMIEQQTWLPSMGLHYAVGVDGIDRKSVV